MSDIRTLPLNATPREFPASRRLTYVKWLRKMHGWIGLWGAVLGLLFGTTGFLLNHRKPAMRIPVGEPITLSLQVPVKQVPDSPKALARQLQKQLNIPGTLARANREPEHAVAWGDQSVVQPEHWQIMFASPRETTQIEYWVGNQLADVKRNQNGLFAFLMSLHRGTGLGIGWMLVTDSLAGSLVFLSLTGILLWTALHKRRLVGILLVGGAITAAIVAVCLS